MLAFKVCFGLLCGEKAFTTVVCDYPSAANMELEDEEYFSAFF